MWQPVSIHFKDLLSHANTSHTFKKGKTVLIYGNNYDDQEGSDSNGCGKSTIIEAIIVALTGSTFRDLPQRAHFIRDGQKECFVEFILHNSVMKKEMRIIRRITKSKQEVEIWEDGEHNTQLTNVKEADKRIFELLGISKDDLLQYYIISKKDANAFFASTDKGKKEIISRFTGINRIEFVLKDIDKDKEELEEKLEEAERLAYGIQESVKFIEQQIEYEKVVKKREIEERKGEMEIELEELEEERKDEKKRIKRLGIEIMELHSKTLDKAANGNVENVKFDISEKKNELEEYEDELTKVRKEIANYEVKLKHLAICPKCSHEFIMDEGEIDVKEIYKKCSAAKLKRAKLDSLIANTSVDIGRLRTSLEEVEKNQRQYKDLDWLLKNRQNQKGTAKIVIKKIIAKMTKLVEKLEELEATEANNERIKKLEIELTQVQGKFTPYLEQIEGLKTKIEDLNYLKFHFGRKGFQTYLINQTLITIQETVNHFLKVFKTNLSVEIDGLTKLKGGDLRDAIQVTILKNGIRKGLYQRFSGGQKARIDICGILAFRKLINLTSPSGGLNLLGLDETMESLDRKGQAAVIRILEQTDITNLVISHNNNDIGAEHVLWVEYRNSISKMKTKE